jgi:hypothetical protein
MTFFLFDLKYSLFEQFENLSEMLPYMFDREVILDKKDRTRLFGVLLSIENNIISYRTKGGFIEKVPIEDLKDARLKVEAREIRQWMQNRRKS